MISDLEAIGRINLLSHGKTVGGELTFTLPLVLDAIRECSANEIAVLGVEIFRVKGDLYQTVAMSGYELPEQDWPDYVKANNALAEEFVKMNALGDQHFYVLTSSSWREFCEIREMRRS